MAITNKAQTVILTGIPGGMISGSLVVNVIVTPRLTFTGAGQTTLSQFADWASWPSIASGLTWTVRFRAATSSATSSATATVTSPAPDLALWQSVFPGATPVDPWTLDDPSARTVLGYSYSSLAGSVDEVLMAGVTGGPLHRTRLGDAMSQIPNDRLVASHRPSLDPPNGDVGTAAADLVSFFSHHGSPQVVPGSIDPDFHQALGLLGDHVPLMWRLGLVFQLRVTPPGFVPGAMVVDAGWSGSGATPTTIRQPQTAVSFGTTLFAPAARAPLAGKPTTHTSTLHLHLDDPTLFTAASVDVEGLAGRVLGAMRSGEVAADSGSPAPRTTGITLALNHRAPQLQADITSAVAAAQGVSNGTTVLLHAEDLIRGYHVQVNDPRWGWLSLGERVVTYTSPAKTVADTDEATVSPAPRALLAGDDTSPLLQSDVLLRWDGWSTGIPRPGGKVADAGGANTVSAPPAASTANQVAKVVMTATYDPQRTQLPTLRFGHTYQFRARAVDVAGGFQPWDDSGDSSAYIHRRYEPIPAPVVLPPKTLTRGESALVVVVRSDLAPGGTGTGKATYRVLVPARVHSDLLEQHGVLDDAASGFPRADLYNRIAAADVATIPTVVADVSDPTVPPAIPVQWLADPIGSAVLMTFGSDASTVSGASFVPGTTSDTLRNGWDSFGAWQSVGFVLAPTAPGGADSIDQLVNATGQRIVRMHVAPGHTRRLKLTSVPSTPQAAVHGVTPLLPGSAAQQAALVQLGAVPVLTPATTLLLVHAVKQPLSRPSISSFDVTRKPATKDCDVTFTLGLDGATMGRAAVVASWTDHVDDGPTTGPTHVAPSLRTVPRTAVVEHTVADTSTGGPISGTLALPDLKARQVSFIAIATSRFVDEFRAAVTTTSVAAGQVIALPGISPESVLVSPAAGGTSPVQGKDFSLASDGAGGTTVTWGPTAAATMTFLGVHGSVTTDTSNKQTIWEVPSAVKPSAPKPLYALPAAVVQPGHVAKGVGSASRGPGRLRIWLERPWWSTGDGELLGIVVGKPGSGAKTVDDTQPSDRLVTHFGADPTHRDRSVTFLQDLVTGQAFGPVTDAATGLVYSVRGHQVTYDPDRDLYWAEVGFATQHAASPFVRLAVCRIQPNTVAGVDRTSEIVTMDPIALLPPRKAIVRRKGGHLVASVRGPVHVGPDDAHRPVLEMSVQAHVRPGDELGWETVATTSAHARSARDGYDLSLGLGHLKGEHRVLLEEVETHAVRSDKGSLLLPPTKPVVPTSLSSAQSAMRGRRTTWLATIPMP